MINLSTSNAQVPLEDITTRISENPHCMRRASDGHPSLASQVQTQNAHRLNDARAFAGYDASLGRIEWKAREVSDVPFKDHGVDINKMEDLTEILRRRADLSPGTSP
jgi:hypothetical protein